MEILDLRKTSGLLASHDYQLPRAKDAIRHVPWYFATHTGPNGQPHPREDHQMLIGNAIKDTPGYHLYDLCMPEYDRGVARIPHSKRVRKYSPASFVSAANEVANADPRI